MAGVSLPDVRPWGRSPLKIPPDSPHAWLQLATWELWMGMLVSLTIALGLFLIVTSPDRILAVSDLSNCYAPPPVALPCERIVYRGGMLNAAFTSLCGAMLVGLAGWFLWELWSATEPKPITDDFLRLLNDSFGRSVRNPLKWPWARVFWAYGFTCVGATLTLVVAMAVWTLIAATQPAKPAAGRVNTSESFSLGH